MTDIHSHTLYSYDSKELPEKSIERAISVGCKVFGFSEHLDYDYITNKIEVVMTDVDAYFKNTQKLKQVYKDKIKLLCGIEFGYDKKAENEYTKISDKYNFDYIINSVHTVNGQDCYFASYFERKNEKTAYKNYLDAVLQSIYADFDYQIAGHIGYVVRNAPYANKTLCKSGYKKDIENILKGIIEQNKVLEINTKINSATTLTLPEYDIIKKYYGMGGRLISFGSDAHCKEEICYGYFRTVNMLKDIGFNEFAYFENKKLELYPF